MKLTKDKAFFQAGTKDKRGVTAQFITTYIDADRVLKVTSEFFMSDIFPAVKYQVGITDKYQGLRKNALRNE